MSIISDDELPFDQWNEEPDVPDFNYRIPYWVEREASAFRKLMRGELAADEQIDAARAVMQEHSDKLVATGRKKVRTPSAESGGARKKIH